MERKRFEEVYNYMDNCLPQLGQNLVAGLTRAPQLGQNFVPDGCAMGAVAVGVAPKVGPTMLLPQ